MAIDTRALQQALGPGVGVQVLAECPSTNTALLQACRDGLDQPQLLVAEVQTAGRGRMGRQWQSWPGASLTFSLAWPWAGAPLDGLSLAVGCALAQALDPAGEAIRLKWPNDLLLGGAKLGGILIETVTQGAAAQAVVVGVGLNVQVPAVNPGQPATGLHALDPRWTPSLALAAVAPALVVLLQAWPRQGWAAWAPQFAQRDALLGQDVQAGAVSGRAEGVDAVGQLRVRSPAGTVQLVAAGELSVRPQAQWAERPLTAGGV